MKWAGRVLLIVLIASTLFVAKQNNFQTETALAQTGSTHNLTLNLNDIEVRVVKNDNSSSTTAGSAIIDSRTSSVYFNKVKVTNNSNQDIYFRITAQLYYGTIPGPCAIPGGSLCTPPNQYRVVSAGQTLTLPDNTFLLPGSMFSFLSGQYPFQTLALQGINKADLKFILSEAGYASTNVTKTQILKWSAVRVKLQNGAGAPVSNKRVGLFKEGESNTQPPPDQWRYGNTNAAGQVAMALLDPITILPAPPLTYTARYVSGTNPQDYTDLPPPIVVTGADFQDLTYTICDGGTGGIGTGIISRAKAQEACLPDFVMDLSSAQVYVNGSPIAPAHLYVQMGAFEIRNVAIKNIGNKAAPPGAVVVVMTPNEAERDLLPDFEPFKLFEALILENIAPNGRLVLPPIRIDMNTESTQEELLDFTTLLTEKGSVNKAALVASVNYDYDGYEPVEEVTNENNPDEVGSFFDWQAFEVTVLAEKDGQTSIQPHADIDVIVRGVYQFEADSTDDLGKSYVTMAANSIPRANYTFIAEVGRPPFVGKAEKDVNLFTYETVQIKIDLSEGLVISTVPMLLDEDDAVTYIEWDEGISSGGTAQITADNNQVFTAPVLKNMAIFRGIPSEVKKVTVNRITNSISFTINSIQDTVNYTWDSAKDGPLIFDNDLNYHDVELKLIRICDSQLLPDITACFYEEQGKIDEFKNSVLPTYAKSLQKLTDNFDPSVRLNNVREVWLVNYYYGGGTLTPITESPLVFRLWTMPRVFGGRDKLVMADLITHEAMHALDAQLGGGEMFSEDNLFYTKSASITASGLASANLTEETGLWAWKNLGHTCSVIPEPSRSNCGGHDNPRDGAAEIFAEQATNVCLFPKETAATFRNYSSIYAANPLRDNHGQPLPEPADLVAHRDVIMSRSIGVGDPYFGMGNILYDIDGSGYIFGYSYILQAIMSSCAR